MILVAAHDEADRIGATIDALRRAFPDARITVADDASRDGTAEVAMRHGAEVVRRGRSHGKGGNMTAAAESVMEFARAPDPPVFLLCDGDLGESAGRLGRSSRRSSAASAGWRSRPSAAASAAASGWRCASPAGRSAGAAASPRRRRSPASAPCRRPPFADVVPFAQGFGMEIGITIDAVRAGHELREYELDLEHRATGRDLSGFLHRGRQLLDFVRVYLVAAAGPREERA